MRVYLSLSHSHNNNYERVGDKLESESKKMYILQEPIDERKVPLKFTKTESLSYKSIWDSLDNISSTEFLPVKWMNWGEAERFAQACKTKKLGKKERPNPYANMEFKRIAEIVYIRGRKGLVLSEVN